MRTKLFLLFLSLGLLLPVYAASKAAKLSVDSTLYSEANIHSTVITKLSEGSDVTVEQRQGAWYQVKANNGSQQGWVRSYDVQINPNINWLARLKSVISGGYAIESNTTATIGIRGLGPGDVKKAAPDHNELKKLDTYKTDIGQGLQYASSAPLQSKEVAYLEPQPTSGSSGTANVVEGATEGLGDVVDGIGNSLGGAVDGLKGLFGGSKDE